MTGPRMRNGIRATCAHRPTSGRFSTSSITFPTYMLAMMVQTSAGCSVSRRGPGCRPYIMNAPISTAIGAQEGMPKAKSGTKLPLDGGVVRAFGGRDALDRPLAEPGRVGRDAPLEVVGQERRHRGAEPRQQPEEEPHAGRAQDGSTAVPQVLPRGKPADQPRLVEVGGGPLDVEEDLAEREEADDDRHEVQPRGERRGAEGEARRARDGIEADRSRPGGRGRRSGGPWPARTPERPTTRLSERTTSAKYSGGPNRRATRASGGVKKVRPTRPSVPATNDEMAEMPSAAPARPWRASG